MEPQEAQFGTAAAAAGTPARNGYGTSTSLGRQQFSVDHNIATIMSDSLRSRNAANNNNNVNSHAARSATARAVGPDLLRGLLMVLMAMDHTVVSINSWPHGQGNVTELDGQPVTRWNRPIGYAVRTMTHLCAPGFFFLLGMGIVYFGRSRSRLGWPALAMSRHFAIRAAVLTSLTVLTGIAMGFGRIWFLNAVLFALGFDYLVVGLLWLLFSKTEPAVAELVVKAGRAVWGETQSDDDAEDSQDGEDAIRQPLLSALQRGRGTPVKTNDPTKAPGAQTSWHIHNLVLLVFVGITIWWNIWLSPNGGRCISTNAGHSPVTPPVIVKTGTGFTDFWFHVFVTDHIISMFPPMGWLSFAVAGMLYARLVLHPAATAARVRCGTLAASLALAVLFVLTRLLHIGNLTEDCLFTPDQGNADGSIHHSAGQNQYLASPQAFFYLAKYPPDVAFFAYTLSVNLLFLTLLDLIPRKYMVATTTATAQDSDSNTTHDAASLARRILSGALRGLLTVLLTFGNSALFFYMIHQFLVFGLGSLLTRLFGREIPGEKSPFSDSVLMGIQSVWAFWGLWLLVMLIMFPLCRWYARFKATKGIDSVWRFF